MALTACSAGGADDSMWQSNEVGGGNVFGSAEPPMTPPPMGTATTTVPTGTATTTAPPTGTATSTTTAPPPTGTATSTTTAPPPTGTATTTATTTTTSTTTAPPTTTATTPPANNSGPCSMTFNFTTVSYGGRYAPNHVEAAWVVDSAGTFIQTLEAYGTIRIGNLSAWEGASFGNTVDAVTGATIRAHRAHTMTWDCTDQGGAPVPDGAYKVMAEFAEENSGGFLGGSAPNISVDFTKGPDPANLTSPDTATFVGISLVYQ